MLQTPGTPVPLPLFSPTRSAFHGSASARSIATRSTHAFSLIELMIVIGIIAILAAILGPSIGGVLKGKRIEQAISTVSSALENARYEAIGKNSYIWVAIQNVAPGASRSGSDEIWLMNFKTSNDSNRLPTDNSDYKSVPLSELTRVEGVSVISLQNLPEALTQKLPQVPPPSDFGSQPERSAPIKITGGPDIGIASFTKLILFTPRGEAFYDPGNDAMPNPDPTLAIGLAQTINGKPTKDFQDAAVVLTSGLNGRISSIRP
jgi:prepilin-type N-terminal cleavage/methylation domain-containing protein